MWLAGMSRANDLSQHQPPDFIFLCPSAQFACIKAISAHMHPNHYIWNEYAFKNRAHKSSKGGGVLLEGIQSPAADGAAMVEGEAGFAAPQHLVFAPGTLLSLHGWYQLCAFTEMTEIFLHNSK